MFNAFHEQDLEPHTMTTGTSPASLAAAAEEARSRLDAHVRETIAWHFDPATGCPFWLEYAAKLGWDPRREVKRFADLRRFPPFEDEWLRRGRIRDWVPRAFADRPQSYAPS